MAKKYELTKDLETGNWIIDNEHRELLQAVNKLLDACGEGKGRVYMKLSSILWTATLPTRNSSSKRTAIPAIRRTRLFTTSTSRRFGR